MSSTLFDCATGIVILSNGALIGLEQSIELKDSSREAMNIMSHCFLTYYLLELCLRFYAFGSSCLSDGWVRFDCVLVASGVFTDWIMMLFIGRIDELGPLMVLRTVRLLRVARVVRFLVKFRELWLLVQGLLSSAYTMLYVMILLTTLLFIFGSLGVDILSNHPLTKGPQMDETFSQIVDNNFKTLPLAMLTLAQFVCLDSAAAIYQPLIHRDPLLSIYFFSVLLIVAIVCMNLVTAVVVNSALETASQEKDVQAALEAKKKKKMLDQLKKLFQRLDDDGSGDLTIEELLACGEADKSLLNQLIPCSDPAELFAMLDVDNEGTLSIQEFCEGVWQASTSHVPLELTRMEKHIKNVRAELKNSQDREDRAVHPPNKAAWYAETGEKGMRNTADVEELDAATCAAGSNQLVFKKPQLQEPDSEFLVPRWARELTSELQELRRSGVLLALHQTWQLGGDKSLAMPCDAEFQSAAAPGSRSENLQAQVGHMQSLHIPSSTDTESAALQLHQATSPSKPMIIQHSHGKPGTFTPHFENSFDTLETQISSQEVTAGSSCSRPNSRKSIDGSKCPGSRCPEKWPAIPRGTPHPPEPPSTCSSPRSILEEALLDP